MKPEIIAAQRERPKIERKFAELKRFHGLKEARYWGLPKMTIRFCGDLRLYKNFLPLAVFRGLLSSRDITRRSLNKCLFKGRSMDSGKSVPD